MKKLYFFIALFLLSLTVSAQFKVELVWKKTSAEATYMTATQRSMIALDDKLYITNQGDANIAVVDAKTGDFIKNITTGVSTGFFAKNCIYLTEDNVALLGSSGTGSNIFTIYVCDLETGATNLLKTIAMTGFGRTDYFSACGSFNSAQEGGYIALASNTGNITTIPMSSGTLGEITSPFITGLTGISATTFPKDDNSFFVVARSAERRLYKKDGSYTAFSGIESSEQSSNSGGLYFKFIDKEFLVVSIGNMGAVRIFNVTNDFNKSYTSPSLRTKPPVGPPIAGSNSPIYTTDALGTTSVQASTAITAMAKEDKGDHVMIYLHCVNNGIAAYKLSEEPGMGIMENETAVDKVNAFSRGGVLVVDSALGDDILVYDISGRVLYNKTASQQTTEISGLTPDQIVIVKIGKKVMKVKL
ncbi:MAG: hypothetical protein ACLVKO_01150 [Dysgonomonas sp.]